MKVRLSRVAEADLAGIVDYYSDISEALPERFISELEVALNSLCANPKLGSCRYAHFLPDRSLRVWRLHHFPFLIFYRANAAALSVLRVLHERRALTAEIVSG